MDQVLDLTGIAGIGSSGVVILVVLSILRGWLVPRRTLTDRIGDKDSQLAAVRQECRDWRQAALAKDDTIGVLARQVDELQEAGRIATAVIQALPRAAGPGADGHGSGDR